jgi:hypothetical protein
MEDERSLQCSQEPTTDPYPEPDKSSPHPHTHFIYDKIKLSLCLIKHKDVRILRHFVEVNGQFHTPAVFPEEMLPVPRRVGGF